MVEPSARSTLPGCVAHPAIELEDEVALGDEDGAGAGGSSRNVTLTDARTGMVPRATVSPRSPEGWVRGTVGAPRIVA